MSHRPVTTRRPFGSAGGDVSPEFKRFVDHVVVPALLERFLADHETMVRVARSTTSLEFPKSEGTV